MIDPTVVAAAKRPERARRANSQRALGAEGDRFAGLGANRGDFRAFRDVDIIRLRG